MQNTYTLKTNLEFTEDEFKYFKNNTRILRHLGENDIRLDEIINLKKYIFKMTEWFSIYNIFSCKINYQIDEINEYLHNNIIITDSIIDGRIYKDNKNNIRFFAIFIKEGFLDFIDSEFDLETDNEDSDIDNFEEFD